MGKLFCAETVTEVEIPRTNRRVRVTINQECGEVFVEGASGITVKFPLHIEAARHREADSALYVRAEQIGEDVEVGFAQKGGSFAGGQLAGPVMKAWVVKSTYRGGQDRFIEQGIHFMVGPHPHEEKQEIRLMPLEVPIPAGS